MEIRCAQQEIYNFTNNYEWGYQVFICLFDAYSYSITSQFTWINKHANDISTLRWIIHRQGYLERAWTSTWENIWTTLSGVKLFQLRINHFLGLRYINEFSIKMQSKAPNDRLRVALLPGRVGFDSKKFIS